MGRTSLLVAALSLLIETAPALAQAAPLAPRPDRAPWTSEVRIVRNSEAMIDNPEGPPGSGEWDESWDSWITANDLPADLRGRSLDTASIVVLEIGAAGGLTGCAVLIASSERRLDRLACDLFARRGSFPPQYAAPGRRVAARWVMRVRWETLGAEARAELERQAMADAAPLPPVARSPDRPEDRWRRIPLALAEPPDARSPGGPENPWPRLSWPENFALASLPDVQADYPRRPGSPAEGTTSLDLIVSPTAGVTGCEIGISSGNQLLDAQSCLVARRLDLAYVRPCDLWCRDERLPLQIVWRQSGSHVRFPLQGMYDQGPAPLRDPNDTRPVTRYNNHRSVDMRKPLPPDPPLPANLAYASPVIEIRYTIGGDGIVRNCEVVQSTGNARIDGWFCQRAQGRLRYIVRTDVFGEPIEEIGTFRLDLDRAVG